MIHPELLKLLETNDTLDILKDSVSYQVQKIHGVEKTSEGRGWYRDMPQIVREKFDNYKVDYEHLFRIFNLDKEEVQNEMNKGYYYWRLLRSACNTYRNDLMDYDLQLNEEFNLKETDAISDNKILHECVGILDLHAIEK